MTNETSIAATLVAAMHVAMATAVSSVAGPLDELLPVPVRVEARDGTAAECAVRNVRHVDAPVPGAPEETADEAYVLEVCENEVVVTSPSGRGRGWAMATLEQLARLSEGRLPLCRIVDWPRYRWRGLMHDSGRNFLEVGHVKALIDYMASYKMNLFHWHLTEYYGWRLESKKYPQLQHPDSFYLRGIGKYYTQEEFREVLDYAASKGVTVMPEFDVPGHALAFRRAFGFKTMRDDGVREKLCDLVDELCALAPKELMPMIHLGSDEARLPEEKVPEAWMQPLVDRVHAAGRTVVGWVPGELASVTMRGPSVAMRWGRRGSDVKGMPSLDGGGYYVETFDPFEIPAVATFRRTCPWPDAEGGKLGVIACCWHDECAGDERGGYDSLRNQVVFPAIAMLSDAFWRGRDHGEPGFHRRLPLAGDPRLEKVRDLERRMVAQRDKVQKDSPHPFSFLRQTDMRWRVSLTNGTVIATNVAQATIFLWQNSMAGVEGAGSDFGEKGGNFLKERGGCAYCDTWIWSPKTQEVGAWIGFTAYDRDHGRAYSGRTARLGEWNNEGASVELNGKAVAPPRWKKPGRGPGGDVPHLLYVHEIDEQPYVDEEYYMREPTRITLVQGWNHVRLTVPKRHAGGHNPWVATFIPMLGTTARPREVPGLKYSCEKPAEARPAVKDMPEAAEGDYVVDFTRPTGKVKPLHGVGNSPVRFNYHGKGLVPEFAEAGIPYVRLHDAVGAFGGAHYVDVENIFPDFDADEDDPASYDFAFTDAYLKVLVDSGVQIFYRLGATIENCWRVKSYHVKKPRDLAKFARVCEHIVRHYNRGWANGHHYGIEYWEVWNEPEVMGMWQGSREEFFELYRQISTLLKGKYPEIKIGGYSSIGFSYIDDPVASASWKHRVDWFLDFCRFVTAPETKCPLDYFSWHCYVNRGGRASRIAHHAAFVRETLDRHGLTGAESILTEWNTRLFGFEGMRDERGAAFSAKVFSIMQYGPVDKAMFYAAQPNAKYCGLFDFPGERTTPMFEVFRMWNEFCRLGTAYAVPEGDDTLGFAAAGNDEWKKIMVVNFKDRPAGFKLGVKGLRDYAVMMVRRIDGGHVAPTSAGVFRPGGYIELPPWSVSCLSTFERK